MMRTNYQYETSPRKLEPSEKKKNNKRQDRLKVVENIQRQEVKLSKEQKDRRIKMTILVIGIFALLLTISYRNSQINEKFNEVQTLKRELSTTQKENEQLKVSIENSLNLNTIEKLAKEKLGMQKLTNKQTVYVTLPKKDYVQSSSEEVVKEKNKNTFERFVDKIFNK